jgi:asparagine synthase (glutamine-hydrolysing)
MVDAETGNVIVFNGEIYNYRELRRALEDVGVQFRSKCDTEVLLLGYAKYGRDILRRLRGMFAFAIYDARRQTVLLARDRLGIKPLYWANVRRPNGPTLIFASELRALLASDLVERRLDPVALNSYLWNGFVAGPNTMVRGVALLPAGTSVEIDLKSGGMHSERYWSLGPRATRSATYARDHLESELLTAAKQHLISDVPLGIFLSGGIDSSAIAALAMRAGDGQVNTFHIGFEESEFDESRYARSVAAALHTQHTEFRLTQSVFVQQLDDAIRCLDQPTFDAINTYFVSRVVREAGFTVALAGTGGDELFGGYQSFKMLPKAAKFGRHLRGFPAEAISQVLRQAKHAIFEGDGRVAPQTRWAKLGDMLLAGGDLLRMYQVSYSLFTSDFLSELVGQSGGSQAAAAYGLPAARFDELLGAIAGQSPLAANSVLELALFIGERLLRDSDSASMAVSLELRVPLLDHVVCEAAQEVPDGLRFDPLGKKSLLRTLAMPQLDAGLFDRPKAGFVLPISVWAKDRLATDIESTFSDKAFVESVGINPDALQRLWKSFVAGAPGMYWSRVWAPYVLLRWCREHRVHA